ncbi:MAG: extracellular solute-binding protein [Acidimicrobiales bacterium]|nr:extracellular solute-binding protein [Acidimicrobiales bacterium]RZV48386.1 MAG: extracellular solute-binding protein [Acidimicrobiales bacterium]
MRSLWILLLAMAVASTSCGAVNPETLAFVEDERPGQTEIRLAVWPTPGLTDAIVTWEREHPTATVILDVSPFDDHHQDILNPLVSAITPDVVAFDAQYSANFRANPDLLLDLSSYDTSQLEARSVGWAWQQGVTPDGSLLGVPVDVGGVALAYRADLLAQNMTRQVEAAESWCELIAVGDMYSDLTRRPFLPESGELFEVILLQGEQQFHDSTGQLILEDSQGLADAWDLTMHALGERPVFGDPCPENTGVQRTTANMTVGSDAWRATLDGRGVGAVIAPAALLDEIQSAAPATAGAWRITDVPGVGGASGSGMHLGIHASTPHAELAWDLIAHLSEPSNQIRTFRQSGRFPAAESTYLDPQVRDASEPFFGDSPLGTVYVESVQESLPGPDGPEFRLVLREFRAAISRVESGTYGPAEAWDDAQWRIEQLLN